jgi:hypothetical protein
MSTIAKRSHQQPDKNPNQRKYCHLQVPCPVEGKSEQSSQAHIGDREPE